MTTSIGSSANEERLGAAPAHVGRGGGRPRGLF
jgi:hypothetical protein